MGHECRKIVSCTLTGISLLAPRHTLRIAPDSHAQNIPAHKTRLVSMLVRLHPPDWSVELSFPCRIIGNLLPKLTWGACKAIVGHAERKRGKRILNPHLRITYWVLIASMYRKSAHLVFGLNMPVFQEICKYWTCGYYIQLIFAPRKRSMPAVSG